MEVGGGGGEVGRALWPESYGQSMVGSIAGDVCACAAGLVPGWFGVAEWLAGWSECLKTATV